MTWIILLFRVVIICNDQNISTWTHSTKSTHILLIATEWYYFFMNENWIESMDCETHGIVIFIPMKKKYLFPLLTQCTVAVKRRIKCTSYNIYAAIFSLSLPLCVLLVQRALSIVSCYCCWWWWCLVQFVLWYTPFYFLFFSLRTSELSHMVVSVLQLCRHLVLFETSIENWTKTMAAISFDTLIITVTMNSQNPFYALSKWKKKYCSQPLWAYTD